MSNRRKPCPALMVQGTGSHVGKSLMVAALARAYTRRGLAVRPFKPQNMSNNAAVADGGEIGRAQALQARACGIAPTVDMNPVLLKPQSDRGAQIVVHGRVAGTVAAADYHAWKPRLLPKVLESFARLSEGADLILVEGAGSPAEVNLRANDIANMGFALAAGVPVVLVGDVDRGGVIASLVGTWELLEPAERAMLKGYIVNRFRGDPALFDGAIAAIGARTGLACLGVVPYSHAAARLPAEDSVGLDAAPDPGPRAIRIAAGRVINIAVPRLPRIANADDLDPLRLETDVAVVMVGPGQPLPADADLVILPGSKSTLSDLAALRAEGWDIDLAAHIRRGGWVLGLCGGYQMLGTRIGDPAGIEGPAGDAAGLGHLDVATELASDKRLTAAKARDRATGEAVHGYEMHMGVTRGHGTMSPMLDLDDRVDGACSADGRVMGCYLHGLFAADGFRHEFLDRIKRRDRSALTYERSIESALDDLAGTVAAAVDLDRLYAIAAARVA